MADKQLYEVESILNKKVGPKQRVLYLVRWKGFSSEHDTWEPQTNLKSCIKLLQIYNDGGDASINSPIVKDELEKASEKNDSLKKQVGTTLKSKRSPDSMKRSPVRPKLKPHKQIKPLGINKPKSLEKKTSLGLKQKLKLKVEPGVISAEKKTEVNISSGEKNVDGKKGRNDDKQRKIKNNSTEKGKKSLKRRLEDSTSSKEKNGPSKAKRLKRLPKETFPLKEEEKINNKKLNDELPVITVSENDNKSNKNGDDDDDDDIRYSLIEDCDNTQDNKEMTESKTTTEKNNSSKSSVISAPNKAPTFRKNGGKGKKTISLMESKRPSKLLQQKADLLRSVSPPPIFTAVKEVMDNGTSSDPSKPSGNSLPDPVSPEASETYLADVPSLYPVPAEEPASREEEQPASPTSITYKSFLDSLPSQFHAGHKGGGKKSGKGAAAFTQDGLLGAPVERRTSVRSTECAFRYKQIVVKKCFRYTQVWLNTQTVMENALNPQVIQEMVSALNSAKYDDSHLVLFSSLGSVFCSGTDLHFLVSGDRRMAARQMADSIRELTKTFITFPKPIIAAVSGAAVGLGVSLLALCDIVYASDKASFHLPYSQLSQTPEGCSSFTLPLTLGLPSANELLFGGRKITAMEAYQLGLVSQVFWPTLMMQEVIPRAQNMATCSAKALEATKLLVRSHHRTKMELTNETECNLLLERWSSLDCQRAVELYLSNEKNLTF